MGLSPCQLRGVDFMALLRFFLQKKARNEAGKGYSLGTTFMFTFHFMIRIKIL
jgi:hypothetical protein